MKKTKKLLVLVLALMLTLSVFVLSACGEDEKKTDEGTGANVKTEEPADKEDSPVVIGEAEFGKDYEGKATIVVNYEWTNTTDETTSLLLTYSFKAYQNGVELETSLFADDWLSDKDDTSGWVDMSKDVKPGSTIKTSEAYLLSDESAPVEVEVSGLWDDDVVEKQTFNVK
jgi:uncharacterized lipoprotein YehR (DUF1307 family)